MVRSSLSGRLLKFFVCLSRERTKGLDNDYTVFGKVTKGLDVVDKIAARKGGKGGNDEAPLEPCTIKKATVETK